MPQGFVVRYQTKVESAEENQRLIEQVFAELAASDPGGLRYASFRLADGVSFVHIGVVEGEVDPLSTSPAFAEFAKDAGQRMVAPPTRDAATLVGSYGFQTK